MVFLKQTVWVGLTGGIGSGKSQVAQELMQLGIPVIDADQINRQLILTPNSRALQEIAATFGSNILNENGQLNRDAMRERIFSDPEAKKQLEAILHPKIIEEIQKQQQKPEYQHLPYGVIELPTLFEHPHFQPLVQHILVVHAQESERIIRVQKRNGFSEASIRAIMAAQISETQRLSLADSVIDNNDHRDELQTRVQQWHQQFLAALTSSNEHRVQLKFK